MAFAVSDTLFTVKEPSLGDKKTAACFTKRTVNSVPRSPAFPAGEGVIVYPFPRSSNMFLKFFSLFLFHSLWEDAFAADSGACFVDVLLPGFAIAASDLQFRVITC